MNNKELVIKVNFELPEFCPDNLLGNYPPEFESFNQDQIDNLDNMPMFYSFVNDDTEVAYYEDVNVGTIYRSYRNIKTNTIFEINFSIPNDIESFETINHQYE